LKLEQENLLSNFAFNGNLRRYNKVPQGRYQLRLHMLDDFEVAHRLANMAVGGGQGLTLVPLSAQLELTLPFSAQLELTMSLI